MYFLTAAWRSSSNLFSRSKSGAWPEQDTAASSTNPQHKVSDRERDASLSRAPHTLTADGKSGFVSSAKKRMRNFVATT